MQSQFSDDVIESLRSAARRLTGHERQQFQAEMALKYCDGSARKAERLFGWRRVAVQTGLHEKRTGICCLDNFPQRGRKKSNVIDPHLEADICELAEPLTQSDPKFQTPLAFTRARDPAVQAALAKKCQRTGQKVPSRRTLVDMMNRLGYRLRRVQKTRLPKNPGNRRHRRERRRGPPAIGRRPPVSENFVDTKAKVKIGEFSREGRLRTSDSTKVVYHDMAPGAIPAPAGILEVDTDQLSIEFGTSRDTSDFVADSLELWWSGRQEAHAQIRRLQIDLGNGPESRAAEDRS